MTTQNIALLSAGNNSETTSKQEIACPDSNHVMQEKLKNFYPAEVLQTTDEQQKCGGKEKRKYLETENEFQPTEKKAKGELVKKPKFDFNSKILDILLQAANSRITPTKLKRKVEKLYVKETGETFSDKASRKYLKKLKQMENIIECTDQYVKLRLL